MIKILRFFLFTCLMLASMVLSIPSQAQQNVATVSVISHNAAEYHLQITSHTLFQKFEAVSPATLQKKFSQIDGFTMIARPKQDVFEIKIDKQNAPLILQKYFALTPLQIAALPK
ncbi:MAG: hypothetical protein IPO27_16620 [Bacteroidetes bacterium]|nr:hypothetical protein [Bacteroidota bacterium]